MAKMGWNEAKTLDETLVELDSYFLHPPVAVRLLAGGLSNRCWKLTDNKGRHYVWRPVTSTSVAFGVDRAHEYTLLQALSRYEHIPNAVAHFKSGLLVEWIEGSTPESIHPLSLMTLLASVHRVKIDNKPIQKFNFTERVDFYWLKLDKSGLDDLVLKLYQRLRLPPADAEPVKTLCHFDIGCHNLIKNRVGYALIDWEYAAIADPRADIAISCDMANLDVKQQVKLYCDIRGIEAVERWQEITEQWLPRVQMMAMLWYYLGYQLWEESSYLEEAQRICRALGKALDR
ncbi:phosphotransferase [Vibrio sp. SCSIO 43136]|uniref:phosphotransferase n=1 Tax=Vibrio sp. SCSIO 43136 TaxID=2819101 RepID=UPI002075B0EA|nr:phosphotransferase [Vibrio sp. SCSIO 43136]USD66197.1 phosphotransferase [Vibrio sp. SCSIO 43136]